MSFAQFKHLAGGSAGYYPVATDEKGKLARRTAEEMRSLIGASPSTHTHTVASLSNLGSNWASLLTSAKPTTLAGYGITDAQPLDADLTAIAALSTQPFGRSLLTQADAPAARTTLDASRNTILYDHRSIYDYGVSGSSEQIIRTITLTKAQLIERGDVIIRFTGVMTNNCASTGPTYLRIKVNGVIAHTKKLVNNGTDQNITTDMEVIVYRADITTSPDLYLITKDLALGVYGGYGGMYTDPDVITITITGQGDTTYDLIGVMYLSAK